MDTYESMIYFYAGLSFLAVHELDAMQRSEWRILPILSSLNDEVAGRLFLLLHTPLFVWIFAHLSQPHTEGFGSFRVGFDVFMLIHALLHVLLRKHPENEFRGWMSWVIIGGAAAFGLIDLVSLLLI